MLVGRSVLVFTSMLAAVAVAACSNAGGTSHSASGNDPAPAVDGGAETAATSSGATGAATSTLTSQTYTTTYDGLTRSYILDTPTSYDANKSYPLVVVFHGNPGSAIEAHTEYPFDVASKEDAIVVYPFGYNGQWDIYTPGDANADMGFVRSVIDLVAAKTNVDRAKVYAFGMSGGAFFTSQMACRYGGVFAAIAIHSGGAPDETEDASVTRYGNDCVQCVGGPVPTFVVHGQDDTTVPSSSGERAATCAATVNGCATSAPLTDTSPSPCQSYACGASDAVELCLVPGLNHAVWDQARPAAWAFFQAH